MSTEVSFDFTGFLEAQRAPVEAALERAVDRFGRTLPADVADAMRHGVTSGGKHMRPIMCVAAFEACRPSDPAIYDLAASLELIHAYSLMHDDLPCMDDGELRRGRPTTHRVHGEDATMRAGAALIPAAALQALVASRRLGCTEQAARRVTRTLLEAAGAGGMVGGQWLDLLGEENPVDAEQLDDLHRRKTGALLTAAVLMGGMAAGASERTLDGLRRYGRSVGLAFQIIDDVLDATQSAETLGKNPSDTALDKSTYVALYGLEAAQRMADREVTSALEALRSAEVHSPPLVALAEYVVARRS